MCPYVSKTKDIYVFAGPNGSGKSTIVDWFIKYEKCPRNYICPDNYVPKNQRENPEAYL